MQLARLIALAFLAAAPAAAQESPLGLWKTEPGKTGAYLHVRIAPCAAGADRLCGVIADAVGATRTDLVGKPIIRDMRPDGAAKWSGGTIWAPDDDKTYRSRMSLDSAGLEVEGCVLVVCRGQTWTRIE